MSIKYYDKSGATPEEKLLAGVSPVDAILNGTSKNAIQNKAVYNALKDKLEAATTDLINYYLKTDVYNKSEVRALIGAVETLTMEVVSSLPVSDISTTTIYLLKPTGSSVYDEYVYISDAWVKIGTTDMDLSGYMLTADFNVAIADYFTKAEINNLLNSYYTKAEIDADFYNKDAVDNLLEDKQDTLTFDSTPTASSSNPVTSDGIKDAIDDTATDVYEVMGKNGAKNYLNNSRCNVTVNSGITITKYDDGSISLSGTVTTSECLYPHDLPWGDFFQDYVYHLEPSTAYTFSTGHAVISGVSIQVYYKSTSSSGWSYIGGTSTSDKYTFTTPATFTELWCRLRFANGTVLSNDMFYPMLRLASDTDPTYQPYAETNYQLTQDKMSYADNGILGAKNLLPIEVSTQTIANVTYTINSDGTLDIQGQNTSGSWISLNVCSFATLKSILSKYKGKQMIFSITSDYDYDTRNVCLYYNIGGTATYVVPNPKEKTFTVPNNIDQATSITVPVGVNTGETASTTNLGIMLRLANDADSNYAPYAMTNRELTEKTVKQTNWVQCIIKMTSNALPTWETGISVQDATDIAKQFYDLFKRLGGETGTGYTCILQLQYVKASDGSNLGSSSGFARIYSAVTYSSMISNNSTARFRLTYEPYGYAESQSFGLWGTLLSYAFYGRRTTTSIDIKGSQNHNTISG